MNACPSPYCHFVRMNILALRVAAPVRVGGQEVPDLGEVGDLEAAALENDGQFHCGQEWQGEGSESRTKWNYF